MSEWIETEIGQIPIHWNYKPLEYFFNKITYGFTNPMPTTDIGPYMITAKDVNKGRILYESARKTSIHAFENLISEKSRPQINDVLITKDGTIGRVAIVDRTNLCISQSVALIRSNNKIRPLFLKYLLETPIYQKFIQNDADGSTIKHIYITRINKMYVAVPPLLEQDNILKIIHNIQEKITLLRQQNQTLEEFAQTLFKHWFVEFEFPNEKGESYKNSGGKMIVSELGEIPEGWRVGRLGNFSVLKSGYAFKSIDFIDINSIKAVKIKDLKGKGVVDISNCSSIESNLTSLERVQFFKLSEGDIVLAMSGNTTGKIGVIPPHKNELYLNQRVGKFFLKESNFTSFLYNFLMSGNYEERILSMGYGSAQPNINPSQIESIEMLIPKSNILSNYCKISDPIYKEVLSNNAQIQYFTHLSDTLLPKLMSGAIQINE